jgi:hypothetical protein
LVAALRASCDAAAALLTFAARRTCRFVLGRPTHAMHSRIACSSCGNALAPPSTLPRCKRCKRARYCDVACQRAHWPVHRASCREAADDARSLVAALPASPPSAPVPHTVAATGFHMSVTRPLAQVGRLARHANLLLDDCGVDASADSEVERIVANGRHFRIAAMLARD